LCIFFLSFHMWFVFLSLKLPSYLTWIGKYGLVYITCHEVIGIHWHDSGWRRGGRCLWICVLDIMIQPFSKTCWSFNPFGLKWMVSQFLSKWLAYAKFALLMTRPQSETTGKKKI
jgi:hypothetical protein